MSPSRRVCSAPGPTKPAPSKSPPIPSTQEINIRRWGYFVTGSGVPADQLPLMSRLVTLDYASSWCRDVFHITADPDMHSINQYGGVNFSHHRVALVDGEHDPWRQAGTHRIGVNKRRMSTDSEPFILVKGGVHHWDEYGHKENATGSWVPPREVVETQEEMRFVKVWLGGRRGPRTWRIRGRSCDVYISGYGCQHE